MWGICLKCGRAVRYNPRFRFVRCRVCGGKVKPMPLEKALRLHLENGYSRREVVLIGGRRR